MINIYTGKKGIIYTCKTKTKVLISSIIRNIEPWAGKFLNSISGLRGDNIDVSYLLIEGNSTDRTYSIIERWADSKINVTLVKHDLPETMKTMDRVMASVELIADIEDYYATVDYIMLIDADIINMPNNMLASLIENMKNYKADIIAPYVLIAGIDHFYDTHVFRTNNKRFDGAPPYAPDNKIHNTPFKVDSAGTCLLFKTKVFADVIAENKKYRKMCRERNVDGYICVCGTAKRMGYRIFADPTVIIRHVNFNDYWIRWHSVENW